MKMNFLMRIILLVVVGAIQQACASSMRYADFDKACITYSLDSARELFESADDSQINIFLRVIIAKEDRVMFANLLQHVVTWAPKELDALTIVRKIETFKDTMTELLRNADPSGFTVGALVLLAASSETVATQAQEFIVGASLVDLLSIQTRRTSRLINDLNESDDVLSEEAIGIVASASDDASESDAFVVETAGEAESKLETLVEAKRALHAGEADAFKVAMDDMVTADDKESVVALIAYCGDDVAKQEIVWRAIDLEFAITNGAVSILDIILVQDPECIHAKMTDGKTSMRRFARNKFSEINNEILGRMACHADVDDEIRNQFGVYQAIVTNIEHAEKSLRQAKNKKKRVARASIDRSASIITSSAVAASKRTRTGPAAQDEE